MRYQEISEKRTTLPLSKGVVRNARGSYGALIAVMSPTDFLSLTTGNRRDRDAIMKVAVTSLDDYGNEIDPNFRKSEHYMPYLNVNYPSGLVTGHEGRHRAAMVTKSGGKSFPVILYFRTDYKYVLTYEKYHAATDEGIDQVEEFATLQDGIWRERELGELNKDLDQPYSYYGIKLRTQGGDTLKGQPDRSDLENWKHAAWKASDIPPYLHGQFDKSVKVPTSRMRVGVVKGYRHYAASET
jgi:hypothetical protein